MRLIDADALKMAFGEYPYNWTNSPEEIQEVRDFENAFNTIDSMPTIDAIPVEWLRKWPKDLREGAYVRDILRDWQEKEAR